MFAYLSRYISIQKKGFKNTPKYPRKTNSHTKAFIELQENAIIILLMWCKRVLIGGKIYALKRFLLMLTFL